MFFSLFSSNNLPLLFSHSIESPILCSLWTFLMTLSLSPPFLLPHLKHFHSLDMLCAMAVAYFPFGGVKGKCGKGENFCPFLFPLFFLPPTLLPSQRVREMYRFSLPLCRFLGNHRKWRQKFLASLYSDDDIHSLWCRPFDSPFLALPF